MANDMDRAAEYAKSGLIARRKGAWETAGSYFRKAQQSMEEAAKSALSDELRDRCSRKAIEFRQLAEDCATAKLESRKATEDLAAQAAEDPNSPSGRISRGTCDRLQKQAIEAEERRDYAAAASYFQEAARAFDDLSRQPEQSEISELLATRVDMLRRRALAAEAKGRCGGGSRVTSRPSSTGGAGRGGNKDEAETSAEQWMVKEKPSIRFADVAGLEDVKEDIRLKMIYPFQNPELAKKFGVRLGGGVLFYGPPGTGKTMLAKATAGEVDATFFRVSAADMLSKWVGEAEQNIKKLFDAAANEQKAIIFIDEIESIVPARGDGGGGGVMQRVVPQILQGMEGFDKKGDRAVLFMGATNVPWQLDSAVLRPGRFDDKVYIPLPDLIARRKMLDLYLKHRPLSDDVDFEAIAVKLEGFSGADIKYICDRSATIPFLKSVASGQEALITPQVIDDVILTAPRSVTSDMLKRFEEWAKVSANS